MSEVLISIWLLLAAAGAGFLWGQHTERRRTRSAERGRTVRTGGVPDPAWQEIWNFLRYDGSGLPQTGKSGLPATDGGTSQTGDGKETYM